MPRRSPSGQRRAFTLLELLVVLVLLGLSAALALPTFRLPAPTSPETALARARTLAVRRGEALRLETHPDGQWQVVAAADTAGSILLTGTSTDVGDPAPARSVVISPLGTCLLEGASVSGASAWDPARCAVTPH